MELVLPISIVLVGLGASFGYGILHGRVQTLDEEVKLLTSRTLPNAERITRLETQYEEIIRILKELRDNLNK